MPENAPIDGAAPNKSGSATDENISSRTLTAFKTEVSSYLAKVIVAAAAGIIGIAGLGIWIYVKTPLPDIAGGVPQGAVMAFDLPGGCPAAWSPFDRGISRTIVGASSVHTSDDPNEDKNGQRLSAHPYQSDGGEERHSLKLDEMPTHDQGFKISQSSEFLSENGNHFLATISVGRDAQRTDTKETIRFTETAIWARSATGVAEARRLEGKQDILKAVYLGSRRVS
jgi:hypothetical protein